MVTRNSIKQSGYESFLVGKNEFWRRMPQDLLLEYQHESHRDQQQAIAHSEWQDEFLYNELRAYPLDQHITLKDGDKFTLNDNPQRGTSHRLRLFVEKGARCILEECLEAQDYLRSIDIEVGEGAALEHIVISKVNRVLDHISVNVQPSGTYRRHQSLIGQGINRQAVRVNLAEESICLINSVCVSTNQAKVQEHVIFNHEGVNAQAEHQVHTVVDERSAADVYSTINIEKSGQGAKTDQRIQHLLLAKNARVFSKPALNIATQEVESQHGAITSMIDDKLIFYMESRGLDKACARKLYLNGYIQAACQVAAQYQHRLSKPLLAILGVGDE